MARYLITGVAGFIGSSLARQLVDSGHDVRGFDNLSTGRRENLEGLSQIVDIVEADICDQKALSIACRDVDFVLHHAAIVSTVESPGNPAYTHSVNVDGTLNVLHAAREASVKRIVSASSSAVYGDQASTMQTEAMTPEPISPYGRQKLAGERAVRFFCETYGMQAISLRYFNVFGPRQSSTSPYSAVIPTFICSMLSGEAPTIYGDGSSSRDFTFISDIVSANLRACEAPDEVADGRVFNIGQGVPRTVTEVYVALSHLLGFDATPVFAPARTGEIAHSCAVIDQAQSELQYERAGDFESGLRSTVDWFRKMHTQNFVGTAGDRTR